MTGSPKEMKVRTWLDDAAFGIEDVRECLRTIACDRNRPQYTKKVSAGALAVIDSLVVQVELRDAEIARLRAVTGPDCPKCGRFLKAEHVRLQTYLDRDPSNPQMQVVVRGVCYSRNGIVCVTVSELRSDHPEIARELGLTPVVE